MKLISRLYVVSEETINILKKASEMWEFKSMSAALRQIVREWAQEHLNQK